MMASKVPRWKAHRPESPSGDVSCAPPARSPTPNRFPRKRYDEVAREVLETSKLAADDPAKQFAMTFFDNKFNSLVPLKVLYFLG